MKSRIENLLLGNGNLIAAAQRAGRSLSRPDRTIIMRVRDRALAEGYRDSTIRALEMEGERGMRGITPMPIMMEFRGLMEMDFWGLSIRLYNIIGDHPLNHSTVSVVTLIHEGLMPSDMTFPGVVCEYLKEQFIMKIFAVTHAFRVLKEKIGIRS